MTGVLADHRGRAPMPHGQAEQQRAHHGTLDYRGVDMKKS
jgi:hypothetical protein